MVILNFFTSFFLLVGYFDILIFVTSFKKYEMGCASKVSHVRFTS